MKQMFTLITRIKPSVLVTLLVVFYSVVGLGQGNTTDKKDSSAYYKYKQAIYWAKMGDHAKAKNICLGLLQRYPHNMATEVLLGRIYSWDRQFDSARVFLTDAVVRHPDNEGASLVMIKEELWSGRLDQALLYCNTALSFHPNSEKLLIEKTKIYTKQARYQEADTVVRQILKINPQNRQAIEFEKYIKYKMTGKSLKNGTGLNYRYDHFNQHYAPWQYGSLYYFHRGKAGGLYTSINYASRFHSSGIQYELNLYPKISRSMKGYLGVAYSADSVFPGWSLTAGLSQALFRMAQLEAGIRYLTFNNQSTSLLVYSGAFTMSFHQLRTSIRTYLVPQSSHLSQSYYLVSRYFFTGQKGNITLALGTGSFPHDYFDPVTGRAFSYATKSRKIRLVYETIFLSRKNLLKFSAGFEKRDYYSGLRLQRITSGIGIERLF